MALTVTLDEETRLDLLAQALLTTSANGAVEALLLANPGLVAHGVFVPAGTTVTVPAFSAAPSVVPAVNPWE